jgi:hypothetical protein
MPADFLSLTAKFLSIRDTVAPVSRQKVTGIMDAIKPLRHCEGVFKKLLFFKFLSQLVLLLAKSFPAR